MSGVACETRYGGLTRAEQAEAIRRAQQGDGDAMDAACRSLEGLAVKMAATLRERLRGVPVDWEQEARIAVWRAVLSYDPAAAAGPAGLAGVAIHRRLERAAKYEMRRPDRRRDFDGSILPFAVDHREAPALHDFGPVHDALRMLSPRQREVLAVRYGLGGAEPCSQHETARRLGVSQAAVHACEARALRELREILAPLRAKEAV